MQYAASARYITGLPVDVLHTDSPGDLSWLTSHQAFKANVRRQKKRAYGDLSAEYSGITEEDRAFLTLWRTSDDKHAHLVGKKRKEASQQEQRELRTKQKQTNKQNREGRQ